MHVQENCLATAFLSARREPISIRKSSSWKPAKTLLGGESVTSPQRRTQLSPAPSGWPFCADPTISRGSGAAAQGAPVLCCSPKLPLHFLGLLTVFPESFFSFCSHFSSHCVHHTSQSTASAANLWSSVICFADFLPKVTVCNTIVQYLFSRYLQMLPYHNYRVTLVVCTRSQPVKQDYRTHFIISLVILCLFSRKCCL